MTVAAISGVGFVFKRGDGTSAETFTAIAEINSFSGPGMSRAFIDVTSLDSTGGYKEFIGGFRDGGQIQLNMNFTLAGYVQMLADFEDDDAVNYQVVFPDAGATTLDLAAFVTDLPAAVAPEEKITITVTLKVTGPIVLTS